MTVAASLDSFFIEVVMAIGAFGVICHFQAGNVFCPLAVMAVGAVLRLRLDGFIMVASLAVVVRIVDGMIVVREIGDGRSLVMARDTVFLVDIILMSGHEDFVEFLAWQLEQLGGSCSLPEVWWHVAHSWLPVSMCHLWSKMTLPPLLFRSTRVGGLSGESGMRYPAKAAIQSRPVSMTMGR